MIILNVFISIVTIIINIWIARYNVGKNRTIYEVEEMVVSDVDGGYKDVNKKLLSGAYTILHIQQNPYELVSKLCILGKTKK